MRGLCIHVESPRVENFQFDLESLRLDLWNKNFLAVKFERLKGIDISLGRDRFKLFSMKSFTIFFFFFSSIRIWYGIIRHCG